MDKRLTSIGKRLSQYLTFNKIGINEFGRITGTSGAQISNIINGKNYGIIKLLNILHVCPDLNLTWLIYGNGTMILPASKQEEKNYKESSPALVSVESDFEKKIAEAELEEEKKMLTREIEKLKIETNSLEGVITYQDMTIEAYKNTISILTSTNQDIKELLQYYKSAADTGNMNRETA